jgi:carbamoyl-phosphate synthase small subunit
MPALPRPDPQKPTGAVVFADGTAIFGFGFGASGTRVGELCFNTSITGYQEILTDPSYAGQVITFTFPHIGNIGANDEDVETMNPAALGLITRAHVTNPSNFRSQRHLHDWLASRDLVGLSGIDTRALTAKIRRDGFQNIALVNAPDGDINVEALVNQARDWPGLKGMDLARDVSTTQSYIWDETPWVLGQGFGRLGQSKTDNGEMSDGDIHVVAVDYGAKRNILRCLAGLGARVTVVPAWATAEEIMAHSPDGIFLSNGPGDPAATGKYAVPVIKDLLDTELPLFGICLGHQMLALSVGAKTKKMHQGDRGANHPVKELSTGKVEITSMNHGFTVDASTLPSGVVESHVSLFDGSNCGLRFEGRDVFSVQHHPEASPGPHDSHYLFERFVKAIRGRR